MSASRGFFDSCGTSVHIFAKSSPYKTNFQPRSRPSWDFWNGLQFCSRFAFAVNVIRSLFLCHGPDVACTTCDSHLTPDRRAMEKLTSYPRSLQFTVRSSRYLHRHAKQKCNQDQIVSSSIDVLDFVVHSDLAMQHGKNNTGSTVLLLMHTWRFWTFGRLWRRDHSHRRRVCRLISIHLTVQL